RKHERRSDLEVANLEWFDLSHKKATRDFTSCGRGTRILRVVSRAGRPCHPYQLTTNFSSLCHAGISSRNEARCNFSGSLSRRPAPTATAINGSSTRV